MTTKRASRRSVDLLALPLIGPLVRGRYGRLLLQIPLLLLALLAIYDGLSGSSLAGLNVSTVSVWVHSRGLTVLALALVGNLFCAACPLMLTRGPSRLLRRVLPQFAWPRFLRNKYLTLGLTVAFLYSYEAFALWSSPWLTAWLIVGYFGAALLTDSLFPAGTFCKFVCPLGNYNFALSGASPTVIQARDQGVCANCAGKYCLNGRETRDGSTLDLSGLQTLPMVGAVQAKQEGRFPGCETRLYVPAMTTSQDCTLCMNCVRACPHENVALVLRSPLQQAMTAHPRLDLALFLTVLTWAGLLNAFAMTPAFFGLAQFLANLIGRHEPLLLAVIVLGGLASGCALSWQAARLAGMSLREFSPVLVPLALATWGGHTLYHFLLGSSTLWPAAVHALSRLGLPLPPAAAAVVPRADGAFLLQAILLELSLGGALWVLARRTPVTGGWRRLTPIVLVLVYTALALWVFSQPMQARAGLLS